MCFDVDVTGSRGDSWIAARFTTGPGVTVLVGPSGIGKTSVLHMIAGLVRPAYGYIRVAGQTLFEDDPMVDDLWDYVDIPSAKRRVGYVFQEPRLFPHLRVRANLLYGAADAGALVRTAAMLDIAPLLDRWPRTLSGGEARRVAIGRALMSDPAFLLLDEPLSSLDPVRREEAMRAIERVRDESGLPILMVTHDEREAQRIAAQVVAL